MARKKNENDYALQTIISKDAAKFLSDLAEKDDRSLVKYTKRVIMEHLKANGYVESNEIKSSTCDPKHEEETQKKTNLSVDDNAKQSANCNTGSSTGGNRNRRNKVAPVPMNFVK